MARLTLASGVCAALVLGLSGCAGDPAPAGSGASAGSGGAVVVDTSFDLKTVDPARQFEPTGGIVDKALYETLITFDGADVTKPVPGLADFAMSPDNKVITLTMKPGTVFSDGTPVTADDAVFSLQRVQGAKGNPSFLLDGLTIAKVDDTTLTITSKEPNPALPYILPNTSLGIVNAKVVKANGGTTGADDKAEAWLSSHSAGSGPYVLKEIDVKSRVTLERNPRYPGTAPRFDTVVLRNVPGETQKVNVQAGDSQVALDLSPDQAAGLDQQRVKLHAGPSSYVVFLLMNQDKAVNAWTANPDFMTAVRRGIDYDKIVAMSGQGAVQPGGIIPSLFVGALKSDPNNTRDVAAAKEALTRSGYAGQEIPLAFANDLTVQGVQLQTVAAAVQAQLKEVGINARLAPAPVASELDAYRAGKESLGLWYWGPDYPDPSNYLAFAPGGIVGLRAKWTKAAAPDIDALTTTASTATGDARGPAYEEWQRALNAKGAFVPLLQPAQNVASATSITDLGLNPVWKIDLGRLR